MARADDEKYWPQEIDDTEDRMGSIRELDFSERLDERRDRVGDERPEAEAEQEFPAERVAEGGMTGGEALTESLHEDNVTLDDLSPDTLFDQTGARDPHEPGGDGGPADMALREVDEDEICGGNGLDEAELARSAPLDGQPWTDDVVPDDGESRHE
ncbi:phosphotransferase system, HPr-related protein [Pseudomonas sp. S75]|uniref:phosphotransferase system, HPr-related protein n=1 Tax=unclassified Pseudomonas TaxID=196821 RepID=UPI0019086623|nr:MULTISPECIES: phosphotransferase system, HPr-related protein [unclassified Pseudomonas]MBJ9975900.1 phosphotransferase system, HPr-related protein [Pseudomonas sp. S30]MBK0154640.1 phosphotransferase system, HPr-related protein [Pseudomonas sp. S75]